MFRLAAARLVQWPPPFGWFEYRRLAWLLRRRMRRAAEEQCDRQPRAYWMVRRELIGELDHLPLHPRGRRHGGPMEVWELYQWHLARGTLWKFFRMFPPHR